MNLLSMKNSKKTYKQFGEDKLNSCRRTYHTHENYILFGVKCASVFLILMKINKQQTAVFL